MTPPSSDHVDRHIVDESLTAPFERLSPSRADEIARQHWNINSANTRRLDTERDDTFLISSGDTRHVLKIAHPLDEPSVIDLQIGAMAHAIRADPSLPLPQIVPSTDGAASLVVAGARDEPRIVRLLTYLPGSPLDYAATSTDQRRAIGHMHGRLSLALADFHHPAADRYLHFDLKQLGGLRGLLTYVADPVVRQDVNRVLDVYDERVGGELAKTRQQVVHHDINADNVLVDHAGDTFVTGILDFGDVVHSSMVGDLGSAMSYAVGMGEEPGGSIDPWAAPFDLAAGFQSARPLTENEADLLPQLVMARLAQRLLLNSWLAASNPANAHYTGRTIARTGVALRQLLRTEPPHDPQPTPEA